MAKGLMFSVGVDVKDGAIVSGRAATVEAVRYWPDGPAILTLTEGAEKRGKTHEQLKYWFAVPVKLIAAHCGYTDTQMSYALLGEWSGWVEGPTGHPVPAKPSIADLDVDEMNALIDWVLIWAPSELEVVVPPPDKNWKQKKRSAA